MVNLPVARRRVTTTTSRDAIITRSDETHTKNIKRKKDHFSRAGFYASKRIPSDMVTRSARTRSFVRRGDYTVAVGLAIFFIHEKHRRFY